jgi:hypothetical protein
VKLIGGEFDCLIVGCELKAQTTAFDRDAEPRRSGWDSEQRSEVLLAQFMVAPVNAQQYASSLVGNEGRWW